jgi:aerobic-type carbon monoxide dehydrogenase small subunit (CoxS/CutS family)
MAVAEDKAFLRMKVNGEEVEVAVKPTWTLLRVLRQELGLTGTKKGCEQGDCGSCTIILDGSSVNACLVLALQAQSKEIETIDTPFRRVSSRTEQCSAGFVPPVCSCRPRPCLEIIPVRTCRR